ncbi:MAG: hypothetical protein R3E08_08205 [Thiotrichaceae bacterium]
MKPSLWLLCCVLMAGQAHAEADNIYLEGISSVGKQKIAYVFVNETKFSLKEGENLTRWKITRIGQRSIVLADSGGKETELVLHNRMPPEPVDDMSAENTTPDKPVATDAKSDKKSDKNQDTKPTEDVPAGYRKVQTPFGEVVVKEDKPLPPPSETIEETPPPTQADSPQNAKQPSKDADVAAPATTKNTESNEHDATKKDDEVRPGYHKVRTPFGDIWIEDKVPQKPESPAPTPETSSVK